MIQLGTIEDIAEIITIINEVKKEMEEEKNRNLYVYKDNNIMEGFIVIEQDNGEYKDLVKTSQEKSCVIHRLTVSQKYRNLGIAKKLMQFAEEIAFQNASKVLKGDTEVSNIKMNNLFKKLGYIEKGKFSYEDYPGNYIYYEKTL